MIRWLYLRARAVADPIPPVAPVMRANRPLRSFPDILTAIFYDPRERRM